MRREDPKSKGLKECAGVVVFMELRSEIRVGFREFCKNNNLSVKIANKKYKIYQKLFESNEDHSS